jgi:hypothetical protein
MYLNFKAAVVLLELAPATLAQLFTRRPYLPESLLNQRSAESHFYMHYASLSHPSPRRTGHSVGRSCHNQVDTALVLLQVSLDGIEDFARETSEEG